MASESADYSSGSFPFWKRGAFRGIFIFRSLLQKLELRGLFAVFRRSRSFSDSLVEHGACGWFGGILSLWVRSGRARPPITTCILPWTIASLSILSSAFRCLGSGASRFPVIRGNIRGLIGVFFFCDEILLLDSMETRTSFLESLKISFSWIMPRKFAAWSSLGLYIIEKQFLGKVPFQSLWEVSPSRELSDSILCHLFY